MHDDDLKMMLIEAQLHPNGVVIRTNAPEKLRQKLYAILRESDFKFTLSIPPETNDQLWLLRK